MIETILPIGVSVGECFGDLLDEPLFPEEQAVVAHAVDTRRREFRTVRGCARAALAGLGLQRPSMVPGPSGAPTWPRGVVGAITHCDGYRAVAATRTGVVIGLGVDGEPHAPLPHGVLDMVSVPTERAQLHVLGRTKPEICWDRLLFSAKESVYKAWFPLTGRWLDFEEARLDIDPDARTFTVDVLTPVLLPDLEEPSLTLHGRWLVDRCLVVTTVVVPRTA